MCVYRLSFFSNKSNDITERKEKFRFQSENNNNQDVKYTLPSDLCKEEKKMLLKL